MLRNALSLALSLALLVVPLLPQSAFAASSGSQPALKAIDPSAAKMDAPPPPEASKPANTNPFNSAIQGRPVNQMQPQVPQIDNTGGGNSGGLTAQTPIAEVSPADEERVTRLEKQAFGSTYSEHEVDDRLEHLEKEVLGARKDGLPGERIARLEHKLLGTSGFGSGAPSGTSVGASVGGPPVTAAQQSQFGRGYPAPQSVPYPQQSVGQMRQQPPQQLQPPQQVSHAAPQAQPMRPLHAGQPAQLQQHNLPPGQIAQPASWVAKPNFAPRAYSPGPAPRSQSNLIAQAPVGGQDQMRPAAGGIMLDAATVASSLIYDSKSGDYFSAIKRFDEAGGTYAHWSAFPVKIRLPQGSPDSWQRNLESVIARWAQYVPVKIALPQEPANVDVQWVNQLPPKALGVTRLNISGGQMRVWVYLLRPSFYAAEIPERTLAAVFTREIGHALGLFGRSDKASDLLFASDAGSSNANAGAAAVAGKKPPIKLSGIGPRDINTLKKLYEAPATPPDLTLEQPLEWATSY